MIESFHLFINNCHLFVVDKLVNIKMLLECMREEQQNANKISAKKITNNTEVKDYVIEKRMF